MEDKIDLLFEKKEFTENELMALVIKINPDIESLEYIYEGFTNEEFCKIYFKKGANKKVCVTADSLIALTKDVINAI